MSDVSEEKVENFFTFSLHFIATGESYFLNYTNNSNQGWIDNLHEKLRKLRYILKFEHKEVGGYVRVKIGHPI